MTGLNVGVFAQGVSTNGTRYIPGLVDTMCYGGSNKRE
jgi:hypothetical protein